PGSAAQGRSPHEAAAVGAEAAAAQPRSDERRGAPAGGGRVGARPAGPPPSVGGEMRAWLRVSARRRGRAPPRPPPAAPLAALAPPTTRASRISAEKIRVIGIGPREPPARRASNDSGASVWGV